MTYPMTIVDTIFKALVPAIPGEVIAGHHADLVIAKMSGKHPRDGRLFMHTGGLIGGGWGAKRGEDGVSATIAINDGDTHNSPTEQAEAKFPLLVEAYRLRDDSGGPGTWRGGLGTEQVVRALTDIGFDSQIERVECRPWGLDGGLSAAGNQVALHRVGEDERAFPSGKVLSRLLKPGDKYILRSGGGGGFGSPLDRELEAIEHDVRQGYVSLRAAREQYGAVIDPATGRADLVASAELRASMRAAGLPADQPFAAEPNVPKYRPGAISLSGDEPKAAALKAATQAAGLDDRCCT
jgi:N-methylhydantoinase B